MSATGATGAPAAPVLEVADLRVEFPTPSGPIHPVDGVSLTVYRGEVLGLVGESGSGKTLTARAVMRLVRRPGRITGGSIRFKQRELLALPEREMRAVRGREVAMIFQNPMTALNPVFSVGYHLAEAFRGGCGRRAGPRSRRCGGCASPAPTASSGPTPTSSAGAWRSG